MLAQQAIYAFKMETQLQLVPLYYNITEAQLIKKPTVS